MDRLDWAIRLIREAQREREYIAAMKNEIDNLSIYDPDYLKKHNAVARKYRRTPNRALVRNNLEMARRILRDECM
jgi:hypothetical protein